MGMFLQEAKLKYLKLKLDGALDENMKNKLMKKIEIIERKVKK